MRNLIFFILIQSYQLTGQNNESQKIIRSHDYIVNDEFIVHNITDVTDVTEDRSKTLYKTIFRENNTDTKKKGILKFPINEFTNEKNVALILEKDININDSTSDYYFISKTRINDRSYIKFNDVFLKKINDQIDPNKNKKTKNFYEYIIPKSLLKNGVNTLKIYILKKSGNKIFNSDVYLSQTNSILKDRDSEKIILSGDWKYTIYSEILSNFKTDPSLNDSQLSIDKIYPHYDFNEEKFTSSSLDDNEWDVTNFPNSFERIFSSPIFNGAVWFRKKINFDELPKEDVLFEILGGIDDFDVFYVNGKIVGNTNCYICPRQYTIPKEYLQEENIFTLLIIDNQGFGGVKGPIKIKTTKQNVDISNGWKYKMIFNLGIVLLIDENKELSMTSDPNNSKFLFYEGKPIQIEKFFEITGFKSNSLLPFPFYLFIIIIIILLVILIYKNQLLKRIEFKKDNSKDFKLSQQSHILIRSNRTDHNIEINTIYLIESKKDYVVISTTDNSYLVRKNLKVFLDQFPQKTFVRVNKSQAINVNQIDRIKNNVLFTKRGGSLKMGKIYSKKVNEILK